ncbi:MAG TPA: hypothetical protein VGJ44_01710 [Kribbellaceae bacterium]|jgi:hypothetical protein
MIDDIETYCERGVWKTRWRRSRTPFSVGGSRERQVSKGAIVARWYGVDHIVRDPDGSIAERVSYRPGGSGGDVTARAGSRS